MNRYPISVCKNIQLDIRMFVNIQKLSNGYPNPTVDTPIPSQQSEQRPFVNPRDFQFSLTLDVLNTECELESSHAKRLDDNILCCFSSSYHSLIARFRGSPSALHSKYSLLHSLYIRSTFYSHK